MSAEMITPRSLRNFWRRLDAWDKKHRAFVGGMNRMENNLRLDTLYGEGDFMSAIEMLLKRNPST